MNVLETWAGPGQIEALAAGLTEVRANVRTVIRTQERHTRQLADLTSDVSGLKTDVAELKTDMAQVKADVAELKADMAQVKADVAELKADMAQVKADVAELKADMAQVKADVADLTTTLKMIVDHLGITGAPVGQTG
ncbi:hypothetical protein GCM10009780_59560 [Actinomadura alba]